MTILTKTKPSLLNSQPHNYQVALTEPFNPVSTFAWAAAAFIAILTALGQSAISAARSGSWAGPTLASLAGYLAADLASGIYHWYVDNYPDPATSPATRIFLSHHDRPRDITRLPFSDLVHVPARTTAVEIPALALLFGGGAHVSAFLGVLGVFGVLSLHCHTWAHGGAHGKLPWGVAALQRLGVLMSPQRHARHHLRPHDTDYCVVSGVWNPLLDKVMFFSALERLSGFVPGLGAKLNEISYMIGAHCSMW